jgi:hypothetical protein
MTEIRTVLYVILTGVRPWIGEAEVAGCCGRLMRQDSKTGWWDRLL